MVLIFSYEVVFEGRGASLTKVTLSDGCQMKVRLMSVVRTFEMIENWLRNQSGEYHEDVYGCNNLVCVCVCVFLHTLAYITLQN